MGQGTKNSSVAVADGCGGHNIDVVRGVVERLRLAVIYLL